MDIMLYLGTMWGSFTNDQGQVITYCKCFMIDEISVGSGSFSRGYRGMAYRLKDEALTRDLKPYDKVKVSYDRRGTIVSIEKVPDDQA